MENYRLSKFRIGQTKEISLKALSIERSNSPLNCDELMQPVRLSKNKNKSI